MRCNELTVMYEEFSETFAGFCFAEFGKQFIIINNTLSSYEQKLYKLAFEYFLNNNLAPNQIMIPASTPKEIEAIEYAKTLLSKQAV